MNYLCTQFILHENLNSTYSFISKYSGRRRTFLMLHKNICENLHNWTDGWKKSMLIFMLCSEFLSSDEVLLCFHFRSFWENCLVNQWMECYYFWVFCGIVEILVGDSHQIIQKLIIARPIYGFLALNFKKVPKYWNQRSNEIKILQNQSDYIKFNASNISKSQFAAHSSPILIIIR